MCCVYFAALYYFFSWACGPFVGLVAGCGGGCARTCKSIQTVRGTLPWCVVLYKCVCVRESFVICGPGARHSHFSFIVAMC